MNNSKINKVLIANRGEIAIRIQQACKKLGLASVSIASEADAESLHARLAEKLEIIGPANPLKSYLNVGVILEVAAKHGCDALHPGYGFLAENAEFAQAVTDAGMIFIGPSPEAITVMGSKTQARERMLAADVPCTPGSASGLSEQEMLDRAEELGFPVLIKAVAGGGGRGMRRVFSADELQKSLEPARAEAQKYFSNPEVYLEKLIEKPRHVEVQVFGDKHGNIVHLGTRDCSMQRRHQKLVEEAPAPELAKEIRQALHTAAIKAAAAVEYDNAGTVEFLVSGKDIYFLEMNTRIQVEHPVTEMVTGVDLVDWQIRVAGGEALPLKQDEIKIKGHSIEFRIYAEDPGNGFIPCKGRLDKIERPEGDFIREDYAFEAGDKVSPYYDAMLSKLIITGKTRADCIVLSRAALSQYKIEGCGTNLDFQRWLLLQDEFVQAELDIEYIERVFDENSLKLLELVEARDPLHEQGKVELWHYTSKAFFKTYSVEIEHRSDGLFLACPLGDTGQRLAENYCRLSNSLEMAKKAVAQDILELVSPEDLLCTGFG